MASAPARSGVNDLSRLFLTTKSAAQRLGFVYEGEWLADQIEGQGEAVYVNGNVYKGSFKNNQRHGVGEMIFANGAVYDGEWVNGQRATTE